jgi:hypothetical protein
MKDDVSGCVTVSAVAVTSAQLYGSLVAYGRRVAVCGR